MKSTIWVSICCSLLLAAVALPASALPVLLPPGTKPDTTEADCDPDASDLCTRRNTACLLAQGECTGDSPNCSCALPAE